MNRLACVLLSVFLLSSTVVAKDKATSATRVDLKKSTFSWKGTKKLGDAHWGKIYLKSAKVEKKKGKLVRGEFVMNMSTFTVDNLEGKWAKKFLGHMKSKDFFETEKYPDATLVLDKDLGGGKYSGTLTIKKKSNPVEVMTKKKGNRYSGTMTFNRTKFGIIYGSGNFFKKLVADKVINDEVTLDFNVVVL